MAANNKMNRLSAFPADQLCTLHELFPECDTLPIMDCCIVAVPNEDTIVKLRELTAANVTPIIVTDEHSLALQDFVRDQLVAGGGSCFTNVMCRNIYLGPGGLHFAQPNSLLNALHGPQWRQVHTAIGTAALRILLAETSIFVPLKGTSDLLQLCGPPYSHQVRFSKQSLSSSGIPPRVALWKMLYHVRA